MFNEPKTRPKQQYSMDRSKTGVCVSADQQVSEQQNVAMKQWWPSQTHVLRDGTALRIKYYSTTCLGYAHDQIV